MLLCQFLEEGLGLLSRITDKFATWKIEQNDKLQYGIYKMADENSPSYAYLTVLGSKKKWCKFVFIWQIPSWAHLESDNKHSLGFEI